MARREASLGIEFPSQSTLLDQPVPRRFQLYRRDDVNGMSGTGIVAEGIEHRDGSVQYHWLTAPGTWQMAPSIEAVEHIHGHNGRTTVRWLDEEPATAGDSKTREELYVDRNRLAVAMATAAELLSVPYTPNPEEFGAGWYPPEDEEDADAEEWAVVWADTPAGQVSWHVPRDLVELTDLSHRVHEWDGHSRGEKNDRLLSFSQED